MSELGNKKILAKNLNRYMEDKNISRKDLSKKLDIPYTTLSDWINGTKYPRIDKIELLANFFQIEKSDLIELHKEPFDSNVEPIELNEFKEIPIYGYIPAGTPTESVEMIDPDNKIKLPIQMINSYSKNVFGLRISGDSMYPKLEDGDVVIIEVASELINGKIAAVNVNGYNSTVKQIKLNLDGTVTIHPINPEYEDKTYKRNNIQLIGYVVSMYRNIKRGF